MKKMSCTINRHGVNSGLLHIAVAEENVSVIEFLLSHHVDVNARIPADELAIELSTNAKDQLFELDQRSSILRNMRPMILPTKRTINPLHVAATLKGIQIATILITYGANPNEANENGESPLIVAVVCKNPEMTEFLLSKGALPDHRTNWGRTAMHYAAQIGDVQTAKLLIDRQAKIDVADRQGVTPLHLAVEAGHEDVVEAFVDSGADLSAKTRAGATPIHFAAVTKNRKIMEKLMAKGCDVKELIKNGELNFEAFPWLGEDEQQEIKKFVSTFVSKMKFFNWHNVVLIKSVFN